MRKLKGRKRRNGEAAWRPEWDVGGQRFWTELRGT